MTRILDREIGEIRALVLRMGSRAEAILAKALQAVLDHEPELAEEVKRDDVEIDRLDVAVDDAVLRALALQAPVAEDLRRILSAKMIAGELERVGDLSRNIAQCAARLGRPGAAELPPSLRRLAGDARRMLRTALDAFSEGSGRAAREVLEADERVDREERHIIRDAIDRITAYPESVSEAVDAILIAKHLERVGDHATNIAEDVIFLEEARNIKHAAKLGG